MKTQKTYLKILSSLQELEERVQLQKGIVKQLIDLGVQEQRNLCSYPKTDQIGIEPRRGENVMRMFT